MRIDVNVVGLVSTAALRISRQQYSSKNKAYPKHSMGRKDDHTATHF